MTLLVVLETVAVGLLAVLVAGLLRSHAEILRRLHELGAGYADEAGPDAQRAAARAVPIALGRANPAGAISGRTPSGDAVAVSAGRPGEATLLLFLSSGCQKCGAWWDALRVGAHHQLEARIVVVGRDVQQESPAALAGLAPDDITIVMSSDAWNDYRVPGSPYAVFVAESGMIAGEGTASTWEQLLSLVRQAAVDATGAAATAGRGSDREARADGELAAAGILPGDTSLYPPVAR